MDSSKKYDNPSPEATANPISKLFFCWILPLVKYGYQNNLEIKDLYNPIEADRSEKLTNSLEKHWNEAAFTAKKRELRPSLLSALRKTFWKEFFISGIFMLARIVVQSVFLPMTMANFIKLFNTYPKNHKDGWYFGGTYIMLSIVHMLMVNQLGLQMGRIGMRLRIATSSLIYRKVLRLDKTSLDKTDLGQVVNLLSNDVSRFEWTCALIHYLWLMPIQVLLAATLMYNYAGVAAFAGLATMVIQAVPIQGVLSRLQGKMRFKIAQRTDKRIKVMNEITSAIQVIKMYAWEKPFEKLVTQLRKYEIKHIMQVSYIRAFSTACIITTERIALFVVVATHVLLGHPLTSTVVFPIAQVINSVQLSVCTLFPQALAAMSETKTSIGRLEDFLLKEEKISENSNIVVTQPGRLKLHHVTASWVPNAVSETLTDITMELRPGHLCCIVGNTGSGKTSILHLLLKELTPNSGKLFIDGTISYASQEPWLYVSNVRNNILFGQPYDELKYKKVVEACALEKDFELFPFGDNTNVGERGVSLSGGQRARINLARAVYREADVYLLDDPLSAVDPHVAKHLFEKCIMEYLGGKTRILVTHSKQFLSNADYILMLENGRVKEFGKPEELPTEHFECIRQSGTESSESHEEEQTKRKQSKSPNVLSSNNEVERPKEEQELIARGHIPYSVYRKYFRSGASPLLLVFFCIIICLAQAFCNSCELWVTYWTNNADSVYLHQNKSSENAVWKREITAASKIMNTTIHHEDLVHSVFRIIGLPVSIAESTEDLYLGIYAVFLLSAVVLTVFRSVLLYRICVTASTNLHNIMFKNVVQATMRFFDTNPSGRILNRFSKDMGTIDEQLPNAILQVIQVFLVLFGLLIMVFIKSIWMMIPALILGIGYFYLMKVFLKGAQDVKRLEGITKAPVFSYVAASLYGLSTIRSSNAQEMVKKEFDNLQDQHTSAFFAFAVIYETFSLTLNTLSIMFIMLATLQFMVNDDVPGGDVGLVVSQTLLLIGILRFGTKQSSDVASYMTSVERVLQYTNLDEEGPFETAPIYKPREDWPSKGKIKFTQVYLRYVQDEEPVLKNISFEIQPAEKIGIVGRTGAGKSTLISALFRLSPTDGTIEIDGVDIEKIGLTDLRSKISIIPQSPTLFSSSVRDNLDPFGKSDDDILWKALESVELKNSIESLDQKISEGGSNLSAGQRQLICLARAIVRNNRILVMDEATANVDPHTDALIQKTIRKSFKACTVLTVAHRLNTIMDSDKIIVMDAGQMMEFGEPHILLQNTDGYFSKMVAETGKTMEQQLRKIAEDTFNQKMEQIQITKI